MLKKIRPVSVNTDIPAPDLGEEFWSYARNFYTREAGAVRAEGYADIYNPVLLDQPLYHIYTRTPFAVDDWVYFGAQSASVTNFVDHTDISADTMTAADVSDYCATMLNSIMLVTNGMDTPWYWSGDINTTLQSLPDWPADTTCQWMRAFKNNAIAGDIEELGVKYENQLYWSASVTPGAPPQSWTPLPSNDAGDNILAQTPGALVDGFQLRDYFIIAKNHSLYSMSYTGGQFVFRFNGLSQSAGVLAKHCMAEARGRLYIFSDGDILVTDGAQIESIATAQVRRTIFSEMNQVLSSYCMAVPYLAKDQIWFCYPVVGSDRLNRAAVFTIKDQTWGFRDLPDATHVVDGIAYNWNTERDWDSDSQPWDADTTLWDASGDSATADSLVIATDTDTGHLFGVDFSSLENTVVMNGVIKRESLDFGDYEHVKIIRGVYPYVVGNPGDVVYIRVGTQISESDPITWTAPMPFVIGSSSRVDCTESGRLISLEISGDVESQWRVYSVSFEFAISGRF